MNINNFLEDMKFDTRLVEKNIQNGSLKKEDYENYLKALSDESARAEALQLDEATEETEIATEVQSNTFGQ